MSLIEASPFKTYVFGLHLLVFTERLFWEYTQVSDVLGTFFDLTDEKCFPLKAPLHLLLLSLDLSRELLLLLLFGGLVCIQLGDL